jgi:hypothetical protein
MEKRDWGWASSVYPPGTALRFSVVYGSLNYIRIFYQTIRAGKWERPQLTAVFRIHKLLGLPDPFVRGMDPDPSIIK